MEHTANGAQPPAAQEPSVGELVKHLSGAALLLISGIAALMGKARLRKAVPPVPAQAVESVQADVNEVKERAHL